MDLTFGGGAHGVKAEQGAGSQDDASAAGLGAVDQVGMVEQGRAADGQQDTTGGHGRVSDGAKRGRRRTFDYDVAQLGQFLWRNDGRRQAQVCEPLLGHLFAASRDGGEGHAADVAGQSLGDHAADGAEAGNANFEGHASWLPRSCMSEK